MPSTRSLLIAVLVGLVVFVVFAFTLVGVVGEAVAAVALLGLVLRGACVVAARIRHVPRC